VDTNIEKITTKTKYERKPATLVISSGEISVMPISGEVVNLSIKIVYNTVNTILGNVMTGFLRKSFTDFINIKTPLVNIYDSSVPYLIFYTCVNIPLLNKNI
jgi:hypothetical protein